MEYSSLSDHELYSRLAHNDEEALGILYQKYWKRMLYKALLKLESDADAEEVVQDTFIDIWNGRHRIQIKHSFQTYIAAIVKYKVMAKMAANKKVIHQPTDNLYQLEVPDHSTQQRLGFSDLQTEIENAIKMLPEKCQLIFRMSRGKGMTDKQIASELEISQKTVEAHISKALKYLRNAIKLIVGKLFCIPSKDFFIFFTGN